MEAQSNIFIAEIDACIQSKHLLKHEFYRAWSCGKLSIECLRDYAKNYYPHVNAFPTYLSAVHCRSDSATRRILLQNLIEEEAGSPNHPELWKNFSMALGVTEEELTNHVPSKESQSLIETFRAICGEHTVPEAIAALYAYEKQIPEICVSKISGLKEYYGMHNPKDWEYFSVHIDADVEHARQEKSLLESCVDIKNREQVYSSVNRVLDALWDFLSGLCQKYHIVCET